MEPAVERRAIRGLVDFHLRGGREFLSEGTISKTMHVAGRGMRGGIGSLGIGGGNTRTLGKTGGKLLWATKS